MDDGIQLALIVLALSLPFLIAVFLKHYFAYKSEAARKLAANENEILRRQALDLQSRVKTLEAIVTDEGYTLRKQIANL
jgi:hypothetical protein